MRGRHTVRAPLGITVVAALVGAAALVGSPGPAAALAGEADIAPIESNLAGRSWTSVTTSSGAATAALAVDADPATAWVAARHRPGQWLTLDLGGAYDNVRKVEVVFPDKGAMYQYVVDASSDGTTWETVVDRSDTWAPGRGGVDLFTRPGTAYLRVTITKASPGATIGVSEISAYNYLRDDLILGADISYADQNTNDGLRYYLDDPAAASDILDVVSDAGMEYVRLRVFNDPRNEQTGEYLEPAYQSPERTAVVAERVAAQGMGLGIDLHYADSWADPSKQAKPTAWAELPFEELVQEVYDYTHDTVQLLVDQGTPPDKVAVGNEIINGFMWGSERAQPWFEDPAAWCYVCYFNTDPAFTSQPGGALLWDYWGSQDPAEQAAYDAAWDRFTTLQAAGIAAVRDVSAANGLDIEVETHVIIDNGEVDKTLEFWDQFLTRLNAKGQDIDVMAHSYYPEWHGSPEHYESNLHAIAAAHPGYQLDIAETSHPATDWNGLPVPNSPYPETVQGQADAIQRVFQIANDLPDNRGVGALVWEPANWQEMISWDGWPTLQFNASIDVYNKSDAEHVLESTVYTTARVRHDPQLPATVDVLTTADGSIAAVPVTWDAVPPGSTSAPGQLIVAGTTELGGVTAIVDVVRRLAPPILQCTRFDRSDLTWGWNQAVTATKGGITVTKPARTKDGWSWTFSDEPLNVQSVKVFSNGGTQSAGTSPGVLTGRHGSNLQWAEFCTSGPAS
ncbi:glycosyl hydrolase 53 family protein [Cellulomonas sp. KRMCY2]|uniref:glycosyl hydrolase 53 family protein n=1 Tax=Cellulomonas sp. KRMCY2 TaxID=1304865 RepID=UPI0004B4A2E8|nr:glycosyl hydrolase 53 family protein [Cellulomonas sp. KRMCY2]